MGFNGPTFFRRVRRINSVRPATADHSVSDVYTSRKYTSCTHIQTRACDSKRTANAFAAPLERHKMNRNAIVFLAVAVVVGEYRCKQNPYKS